MRRVGRRTCRRKCRRTRRRGFILRDLAATPGYLVVAVGMLGSLTGAIRDLGQTRARANNLRLLFAGMTADVNQCNSYPPHAPYPQYMAGETVNGVDTLAWDPDIGSIMTHELRPRSPAADSATGHFKWYGVPFENDSNG